LGRLTALIQAQSIRKDIYTDLGMTPFDRGADGGHGRTSRRSRLHKGGAAQPPVHLLIIQINSLIPMPAIFYLWDRNQGSAIRTANHDV
jgi:hypothetical protein